MTTTASQAIGLRPGPSRDRLLAACRREPTDATPIWFMRQAGGVVPGYAALREKHGILGLARTPELCAQVSVMAADAFDTDAAVMYADVLLPLGPMGIEFELRTEGPVIANPVRSIDDVRRLRPLEPEADAGFVLEAISLVRGAVAPRRAVVGIAGGPFTLAAYLIDGGATRDYPLTRAFMYREPAAFSELLGRLADATGAYLAAQVRAGADVVQLFDTHAGQLDPETYGAVVAPHVRRIFAAVPPGTPTIHFAIHSAAILPAMVAAGGSVIGIDHRQSLADAWAVIGPDPVVQGNLDGARLLAGWEATRTGADAVLDAAAGRPGHVFNLGHGVAPGTDPGILADLVAHVRERSHRP